MTTAVLALLLAACTPTPASLDAPAHTVTDPGPFSVPARVLAADGEVIADAAVEVGDVGDPAVLDRGAGGVLRCLGYGVSTVSLRAGAATATTTVTCDLVKEVQVRLPTSQVVLTRDADGALRPESLGALEAAVIGLDDAPIAGLQPRVAVENDRVLRRDGDAFRALAPGLGRIQAVHGTHTAEHLVLVGEEVARRAGLSVPAGEGVGLPLEAGRYTIWIGADRPVAVSAEGAACRSEAALRHALRCSFAATGTLRLETKGRLRGGGDAQATLRAVRWPAEGPEPSM